VDAAALPAPRNGDPWTVHLGLSADTLRPVAVDLSGGHLLVTGPPRSGRSSAAALVGTQLSRTDPAPRVVTVDGRSADPVAVVALLADLLEAHGPAALVVDGLADLLEAPGGDEVDQVLTAVLREHGMVRVVATVEADALARCYATSARLLRAGRRGLLLRPDPDLHPPLLHTTLPPHDELEPAPGRGWLVGTHPDAGPVAVQLARAASHRSAT
jgi:S-DNA-T family DNA segregation ATPase FtsK/SpoIIIE